MSPPLPLLLPHHPQSIWFAGSHLLRRKGNRKFPPCISKAVIAKVFFAGFMRQASSENDKSPQPLHVLLAQRVWKAQCLEDQWWLQPLVPAIASIDTVTSSFLICIPFCFLPSLSPCLSSMACSCTWGWHPLMVCR